MPNATDLSVKDAAGATQTVSSLDKALAAASSGSPAASVPALVVTVRDANPNGPAGIATSAPVVPADQYSQYEPVIAGQTDIPMGTTGATGDYLAGVLVFPQAAACGAVTIKDNTVTIGTFPGGGTTALPSLVPFMIPVGLFSVSGAWKISTGTSVTACGIGKFT